MMKNFISKKKSPLPLPLALVSAVLISFQACDESSSSILAPVDDVPQVSTQRTLTPASVARMLAEVPITLDQVREVWDGVTASSDNGYDEEYTFSDMFSSGERRNIQNRFTNWSRTIWRTLFLPVHPVWRKIFHAPIFRSTGLIPRIGTVHPCRSSLSVQR